MLFPMDGNISDKERAEYVNKLQNMVSLESLMPDIYREIAGNNLKETTLLAMRDADILCKKALQLQRIQTLSSDINVDEILANRNAGFKNEGLANGRHTCSSDVFRDNWGAAWFMNNFSMLPRPMDSLGLVITPALPANFRQ